MYVVVANKVHRGSDHEMFEEAALESLKPPKRFIAARLHDKQRATADLTGAGSNMFVTPSSRL